MKEEEAKRRAILQNFSNLKPESQKFPCFFDSFNFWGFFFFLLFSFLNFGVHRVVRSTRESRFEKRKKRKRKGKYNYEDEGKGMTHHAFGKLTSTLSACLFRRSLFISCQPRRVGVSVFLNLTSDRPVALRFFCNIPESLPATPPKKRVNSY